MLHEFALKAAAHDLLLLQQAASSAGGFFFQLIFHLSFQMLLHGMDM